MFNQEETKIKNGFLDIITKLINNQAYIFDKETIKKSEDIKLFLINNPNNETSIKIKTLLKTYYLHGLNNEKLKNALNMDNKRKYGKIQDIFKNIPFLDYNNILFFNSIIYTPNEYFGSKLNYYNGLFWFLENNGAVIDEDFKEKILVFIKNNSELFNYSKTEYGTIEEEKKNHFDALRGKYTDDYYKFIEREKAIAFNQSKEFNEKDAYFKYLHKKIGNIGELDFYMYINKLPYTVHTAKELGDGFGYDIYCYDDKREIEQLVEIKTTTNVDKETFELTEKEYQEMIKALENENTEYFVCLTCLDIQNNYKPEHQLLKAIDEYTLVSGDGNIEYIIDHNDKNKITFIKNSYVKRR